MEWLHDSLAFVPYPLGRDHPVYLFRHRDAMNEAVRHQRALVRGVASSWVAAFPQQADAWLALAMSLAAQGESSALDTLSRARSLAHTSDERVRIAGAEVGLQLAFGVRDGNDGGVRRARVLADSLLDSATDDTGHALLLSSLAALTGRANIAARYARSQLVASALAVPDPLRNGAARLLVFSAIGGPPDSLRVLEPQVADLITRGISPSEQQGRRLEFLARAASMAFPRYRFNGLDSLAQDGDALVILQSRLVHADSVHVRRGLAALGAEHRGILPEHLAIDALAPEAALLWSVGDANGVIQWLEPTLAVLPQMQPGLLTSPLRAASLTPALLLRARAEAKLADRAEARRSASAVVILWSNADPFLQPLFEEAQRLTR
jgi:hypothetical protein